MKKFIVLFVSILLCTSFSTVVNGQGKSPIITRDFPRSSIKEVEATTSGGSITLTGNADSKAIVEVYATRDRWSDEKIKQVLDENYTIDIKLENGKLLVSAKQKNRIFNWNTQGLNISFKISSPILINSKLLTSGGSIQISDLSGSQNFTTSGGSLTIENLSGNIVGQTSGGSITVINSKDNIDLKTSGGSITAKDCSGKIDLKTSGGSLNMNNLKGNIKAATSGGSVTANDIEGTLVTSTSGGSMRLNKISGNVDAKTSGGSMEVKMKSTDDYVKLSNSGNISLNLPAGKGYNMKVNASNKVETTGLKDFSGSNDSKSLNGKIGNGGAEINVKSSQRVRLSFD